MAQHRNRRQVSKVHVIRIQVNPPVSPTKSSGVCAEIAPSQSGTGGFGLLGSAEHLTSLVTIFETDTCRIIASYAS